MGKIIDVCLSEKKGVQKKRIDEGIFIEDFGLQGDAHAGKWHRQVSLLSLLKPLITNQFVVLSIPFLQKLQKAYEAEHAFLRMGHLKLQQLII